MAELAATNGMPPPNDLPRGECICTRVSGGNIRIDRADPRILISGELLDTVVQFGDKALAGDWVALNAWLDTAECMPPPHRATYVGAILKIAAVNQTVIYRITEYVPRVHAYIGEWPD